MAKRVLSTRAAFLTVESGGPVTVPMDLPTRVDDLSLLKHSPLCDYLAVYECVEGSRRSQTEQSVAAFVKAMQQSDQVRTRNVPSLA